jgi:uncharacterized repeat protein (TIGR01451 family)
MRFQIPWIRQQGWDWRHRSETARGRSRTSSVPLQVEGLEDRRLLTATFHKFPLPTANAFPFGITAGPDGNLWFAESNSNAIGRITTAGAITEFPAGNGGPEEIASGPDGNLWFTQELGKGQIGRITPSGTTTFFPVPTQFPGLFGITLGPDGNLWFTEHLGSSNRIGRITPTGVVTEFPIPTASSIPLGIAAGPDGNLWFAENGNNAVGRITPAGAITEFPIPTPNAAPTAITAGSDGNLWFNEDGANQIGRITTTGKVTEFPLPATLDSPAGITVGADGNLYFGGVNAIGQITPTGTVTAFPYPGGFAQVEGITSGPDGNIWFTDASANQIDELVLSPPSTAPDLSLSGDAPGSANQRSSVTYTLTVTNNGTASATGVTLTDTLPTGVRFVSATGGVTPADGILTLHVGNLDPGASVHFIIVVTPTAAGTLRNQADVVSNEADPTPADDSITEITTITAISPTVSADGPVITSVERFGSGRQPAGIVLTFNEPLDPTRAQDPIEYLLFAPGRGKRSLGRIHHAITISSAAYDAGALSVALSFAGHRLKRHAVYELLIRGTAPGGLTGLNGLFLDGRGTDHPGTDDVILIDGNQLVLAGPGRRGPSRPYAR